MIYLAADAKSQKAKSWIQAYLEQRSLEYTTIGPSSDQDKEDITEFMPLVAQKIAQSENSAIVMCGNGIGVSICLNRYKGVRAGLASTPKMAEWGRQYDNCNALCLAAWALFESQEGLRSILDAWFGATFDPIPRRLNRLEAMDKLGP